MTQYRKPTAADIADLLEWLTEQENEADEKAKQAMERMFYAGWHEGKGNMAFRARMWIIERLSCETPNHD